MKFQETNLSSNVYSPQLNPMLLQVTLNCAIKFSLSKQLIWTKLFPTELSTTKVKSKAEPIFLLFETK